VPRPIAWVSTTSASGIHNIAPFSFFNAFSADPMILGFAPMASDDRPQKDTLANVKALGEFVINIRTESTLVAMDATGRLYPPEVDEFVVAGSRRAVDRGEAAANRESPINFECKLHALVPLGEGEGSATSSSACRASSDRRRDRARREDRRALLRPVARMGGPFYARRRSCRSPQRPQ